MIKKCYAPFLGAIYMRAYDFCFRLLEVFSLLIAEDLLLTKFL